ncbi:MAG: hypothetical protein ACREOU_13925 [Candidatus Eiseniibacteriota bacterium]
MPVPVRARFHGGPIRRALLLFALLLGLAPLLAASAQAARVSSVGLVDYSKKAFKIGDWVRYRVEVANDRGVENTSFQEVRIVGEDVFRGEKCFWLETWFGADSLRASRDLVLVSYDAFKDKDADVMFSLYMRMMMFTTDDEGIPEMQEIRKATAARARPDLTIMRGKADTLGVDTLQTEMGPIEGRLVSVIRKLANPKDTADSTVNQITYMDRKQWLSKKVPITSLVKEEEFFERRLQAYKLGTVSTDAPEAVIDNESRVATVVAWGTGAKSALLELWREKKGFQRAPEQFEADP